MVSSTNKDNDSISFLYLLIPAALLSVITAIIYWPSLHYAFQFDDIANIQKHFNIRHYSFSGLFFTGSRWISYWLNSVHYQIGKFDPFSYRVGNLIIHSLNGTLIFFVTYTALNHLKKKTFFSIHAFALSFLTALLFLLHPVQTQTVSYVIQGQLEGLSTFFILSMILVYLHRAFTTHFLIKGALTALLFVLAAFSSGTKEIAIISPLLIMLIDWFFVAQGNIRSFISRLWLFVSLSVLIVGLYLYFLKPGFFTNIFGLQMRVKNNIGNIITQNPDEMISPWSFFRSQFKVILHYISIFFWPFSISVEYDWVLAPSFFALDCLIPLCILMCFAWFIVQALRNDPTNLFCFGALWFFFCIAPRSSIIPSPELLVDYKTYMASYGLLFLIATVLVLIGNLLTYGIKELYKELNHRHVNTVGIILITCMLGYSTYQRNTVWRSGIDFWGNVIANAPRKARAYNNYGVELSQHFKKYKESIPYFKKAAEMDDKYADPRNNLAVAYSHLGETDAAIEALREGLKINKYYPEGYNNLASFFLQKASAFAKKKDMENAHKEWAKAEKVLEQALKLRPHYGKAFFNLGRLYLDKGDKQAAWEYFKKACTAGDLDNELGFITFAKISLSLKKYEDAIFGYTKALEYTPLDQDAIFNLGNAYFFTTKYEKAIQCFKKARDLNPEDTRTWYNLGEAYFKHGNYAASVETFEHIRSFNEKIPQMNLRIASCYDKLEKRDKAIAALEEIVIMKHATVPNNVKELAREYLAQLSHRTIVI